MAIVLGGGAPVSQNITPSAWIRRFTLTEQAAIHEAAKTDSEVEAVRYYFDKITDLRGIDPLSESAHQMLLLLASKALIAEGRVDEIRNAPIMSGDSV